jgi:hypothetical protein
MNHLPPAPSPDELAQADWHKATKSNGATGCVEVAHLTDWIALRDSKNPDEVQLYTPFEWECFLDGIGKGEFNRS